MTTQFSKCARCAGPGQLSCPICLSTRYCSVDCLTADTPKHTQICQWCKSCGQRKKRLSSTGVCSKCAEGHIAYGDAPLEWKTNGGPVALMWKENNPAKWELLQVTGFISDEDSDNEAHEEFDSTLPRVVIPRKVVTLDNLEALPSRLGEVTTQMRQIVSTTPKLSKQQNLAKAISETLPKVDEYVKETTELFANLRKTIMDNPKLADSSVAKTADLLRKRCLGPSYLAYLDKLTGDWQKTYDEIDQEIRRLETSKAGTVRREDEVVRKRQEGEQLNNAHNRLATEFKQLQSAMEKLEAQIEAEKTRAQKEIASLKAQVEGGKGVTDEKIALDTEKKQLIAQARSDRTKADELSFKEKELRLAIERLDREALVVTGGNTPQAIAQASREEEDEETCTICLDREKDIMLFTCGHEFCLQCIADMSQLRPGPAVLKKCPNCSLEVTRLAHPAGIFAANVDSDGVITVIQGQLPPPSKRM